VSADFADYIEYWKHNDYWLFDSPEIIHGVVSEHSIQLVGDVAVLTSQFSLTHWQPPAWSLCEIVTAVSGQWLT